MLNYLNYFKMRYLNQKGQGIVEYAVILAVVVAIGVSLSGTGALGAAVTAAFAKVTAAIAKIATPA